MEQKDFLMREIEKIGLFLQLIFDKLRGKEVSYALQLERQFEEAKAQLLNETGFNLEVFLSLQENETAQYMSQFRGFNAANIELLADVLCEMATQASSANYFAGALCLYELCNRTDKTFSFEREHKIEEIKKRI
ncbi:MAG: hypothetical protein WCH34_08965 [Bacteroidota bacterium]